MSASFYDLLKYAKTGIASPDMTYYDKLRASTLIGGVVQTLTGIPPLSFKSDGTPLISWSMKGNGQQQGTPTPDNPILPEFVGTLDDSDWTIPITCGGQTVPVYLGQTQTVRRIGKYVFNGAEQLGSNGTGQSHVGFTFAKSDMETGQRRNGFCSHFKPQHSPVGSAIDGITFGAGDKVIYVTFSVSSASALNLTNVASIKTWLAAQYAAGTPVTVWYVIAEPETAIVNEPLCKIGNYADELSSEDAAVTIPTVRGQNVLTVGTDLPPSEMTITYKG